MPNKEI